MSRKCFMSFPLYNLFRICFSGLRTYYSEVVLKLLSVITPTTTSAVLVTPCAPVLMFYFF